MNPGKSAQNGRSAAPPQPVWARLAVAGLVVVVAGSGVADGLRLLDRRGLGTPAEMAAALTRAMPGGGTEAGGLAGFLSTWSLTELVDTTAAVVAVVLVLTTAGVVLTGVSRRVFLGKGR